VALVARDPPRSHQVKERKPIQMVLEIRRVHFEEGIFAPFELRLRAFGLAALVIALRVSRQILRRDLKAGT
jgi:hypothetical protein